MRRLGECSDVVVSLCNGALLDLSGLLMIRRESGYFSVLSKLVPLRASPMNDVLIGWPSTKSSLATKLGTHARQFDLPYTDLTQGPECTFGKVVADGG